MPTLQGYKQATGVVTPTAPAMPNWAKAETGFLKGLPQFAEGGEKLLSAWFNVMKTRQERDAGTSLSKEFREQFAAFVGDEKYQGAGADHLMEAWDEKKNEIYENWSKANPDISGTVASPMFDKIYENYANRIGSEQVSRQAAWEVQSKVNAAQEVIDTQINMTPSLAGFQQMAEQVNAIFPNDPNKARAMIDKGTMEMAKSFEQENPAAFVKFASSNMRALTDATGAHNKDTFLGLIQQGKNQLKVDEAHNWQMQQHARQTEMFLRQKNNDIAQEAIMEKLMTVDENGLTQSLNLNEPIKDATGNEIPLYKALKPEHFNWAVDLAKGSATTKVPTDQAARNLQALADNNPGDFAAQKAAILEATVQGKVDLKDATSHLQLLNTLTNLSDDTGPFNKFNVKNTADYLKAQIVQVPDEITSMMQASLAPDKAAGALMFEETSTKRAKATADYHQFMYDYDQRKQELEKQGLSALEVAKILDPHNPGSEMFQLLQQIKNPANPPGTYANTSAAGRAAMRTGVAQSKTDPVSNTLKGLDKF